MFSMLKNDACPNFFNGGTVEQYEDYRMFVLSRLQNLQVLDSTQVTDEERKKAKVCDTSFVSNYKKGSVRQFINETHGQTKGRCRTQGTCNQCS